MRRKFIEAVRVTLSVILFSVGVVNLKNFSKTISLLDISYETFFEPLLWMILMALGLTVGAGWVRRQFRS
jgi:hypothetical protein